MSTPHILVFYGSKRPDAAAPKVASWLKSKLDVESRATFTYIDLAELDLPVFNLAGALLPEGPFPTDAHRKWSDEALKADGFIVITNEYNHAPSPIIKNAIDYLKAHWGKKPVAIMSHGGVMGGGRAAEHLRQVFAELYAMTIREHMSVHHVYAQFDESGKLKDEAVTGDMAKFMDLLLWWTNALKIARSQDELVAVSK